MSAQMASGVGVAAIGVAGAALGAVCPICVVAAPALIGAGVYKRWRAGRAAAQEKNAVEVEVEAAQR